MSKDALNDLYGMLKNITGENGIRVSSDFGRGIRIIGDFATTSNISFKVTVSGATATVAAGLILFQSSNETIAQATASLSGATEYVYVYETKDHSSRGIDHAETQPVSDATRWVWILAYLTASGSSYVITKIHYEGDIHAQWILNA